MNLENVLQQYPQGDYFIDWWFYYRKENFLKS